MRFIGFHHISPTFIFSRLTFLLRCRGARLRELVEGVEGAQQCLELSGEIHGFLFLLPKIGLLPNHSFINIYIYIIYYIYKSILGYPHLWKLPYI